MCVKPKKKSERPLWELVDPQIHLIIIILPKHAGSACVSGYI